MDEEPPYDNGCLTGSAVRFLWVSIALAWLGGSIWLFIRTGWHALSVSVAALLVMLLVRLLSKFSERVDAEGQKSTFGCILFFLLFGLHVAICCGGYLWVRSLIRSFFDPCSIH